jgi:type I restriction enzyme S subunit
MKSSWPTKQLAEICKFQGGTQPPKSFFVYEPREGYVRLLQIRDFTSDEKATYIPDSPKLRKCTKDDILIGRYGASVGKVLRGKEGAYNVAIIKTIPDTSKINKDYLYYFLLSPLVQNFFNQLALRSAQAGFTKEEIGQIEIPLPPLRIQKRIVARIEELFEKIDKAKQLREKALEETEQIFQSALQEVFDKADKKWGVKKLGEISNVFAGSSAPQGEKYFDNGKYPFVRVQDLARHGKTKNLIEIKDKLNELALKDHHLILAKKGTILFPKSGAAIFANSRAILGIDAYIVGHLAAVVPDQSTASTDWIFYFLWQFDMTKLTKTTALPSLKLSQIKEIQLPFPPLSEQKRIVAYLDNLREKIEKLKQLQQKQLEELTELKNSILDKAFKGELL